MEKNREVKSRRRRTIRDRVFLVHVSHAGLTWPVDGKRISNSFEFLFELVGQIMVKYQQT